MDRRQYDILSLEAKQRADKLMENFFVRFYAREQRAARTNMQMVQSLMEIMQEPPPMEEVSEVPEVPEPQFEEAENG